MKQYLTFVLMVELVELCILLFCFALLVETDISEKMEIHTNRANLLFKKTNERFNRLEVWQINLYNRMENYERPIGTKRTQNKINIPKEIIKAKGID